MVLKLVHSWRTAGTGPFAGSGMPQPLATSDEDAEQDLDYDDPLANLIRERKADKQKRQAEEVISERRIERRQASQEKEQDDDDRRLRAWFASEQYRQAMAALSAENDDARKAVALARERAGAEQRQTREALEKAQSRALVVDGGRRVYFTCDGSRLYGDDDRQITEAGTVAEAHRQHLANPNATTYEDYADKKKADRQAAETIEKLRAAAARLDELEKRIKKGDLRPEELAQARSEQQNLVEGLPPAARAEYERLHEVRKDESKLSYGAADPAFTSAPGLNSDFSQAVAVTVAAAKRQTSRPQDDRQTPAYKAAPDY